LRGCIGSILAHRPLIEDLIENAKSAAFSDPRFNPVNFDEIKELSIAISLLSQPEKMHFSDEESLLKQIQPYKDGIIIKERHNQAVYLPSVWEELNDKKEFLNSLKIKAGLPPDYFSKTFEAYRFRCEYIEEKSSK
jgi:AmmeMemoRadiSam system protein A